MNEDLLEIKLEFQWQASSNHHPPGKKMPITNDNDNNPKKVT